MPGISEQRFSQRVGQIIEGKWRIDALISSGPIASLYVATGVVDGKTVALKLLHSELARDEATKARFEREREVANAVGHPGVVRVFGNGVTEDGALYLVMELLDGKSLEALRQRTGGVLPVEQVVKLGRDILEILTVAHAKGIVHRDIKPANVFLLDSGEVKLLDFGIAWDAARSGPVTGVGVAMGTPAFMPPEQALARRDEIDTRSDIWAVGATLFTLLSGKPVHDEKSVHAQLVAASTKPAPSLRDVAPSVPRALAAVVDRALSFDRAKRWDDAESMREALRWTIMHTPREPFPRPETPTARPPPSAAPAWPAGPEPVISIAERLSVPSPAVDSLVPAQNTLPVPAATDRKSAAALLGGLTGLATFAVALTVLVISGKHAAAPAHGLVHEAPPAPASAWAEPAPIGADAVSEVQVDVDAGADE